jgi:hypothetical protein
VTKKGAAEKGERENLLAHVKGEGSEAHLSLAWRRQQDGYRVRYVEIDEKLADEFLGYAGKIAENLAGHRTEVAYDPEWPLADSEFFALAAAQIPGGDLFPALQNFLDLERYEKANLPRPRLYTVAVQRGDEIALFGKRMAYLKSLSRRKGVFSAVWDGNTFSELEEAVATFAETYDWVLWRDVLYVLNAKNFLAEFRDQQELKESVREHVDTICEHIEIRGADEFAKRCQSSVGMASKLQKVAESGIWDRPVATLKIYAEERGIDVEWDGDALVFDGSIEHQQAILKLLDEGRTLGPVSGRTFDSAAKQVVEVPGKSG